MIEPIYDNDGNIIVLTVGGKRYTAQELIDTLAWIERTRVRPDLPRRPPRLVHSATGVARLQAEMRHLLGLVDTLYGEVERLRKRMDRSADYLGGEIDDLKARMAEREKAVGA